MATKHELRVAMREGGTENPVFMRVPRGRPLGTRMDAGFGNVLNCTKNKRTPFDGTADSGQHKAWCGPAAHYWGWPDDGI